MFLQPFLLPFSFYPPKTRGKERTNVHKEFCQKSWHILLIWESSLFGKAQLSESGNHIHRQAVKPAICQGLGWKSPAPAPSSAMAAKPGLLLWWPRAGLDESSNLTWPHGLVTFRWLCDPRMNEEAQPCASQKEQNCFGSVKPMVHRLGAGMMCPCWDAAGMGHSGSAQRGCLQAGVTFKISNDGYGTDSNQS